MKFTLKLLSIVLTNLLLFLLVIAMTEGIFRIAGIPYSKVKYIPDENSFARFDQELGWSYIPNKSSIHNTEHIAKPVYFEENGFRAPYPGFEFDYSKPSILFIGDSFTMGHGLTYEESFVGKFSATIKGTPFQAVNLGVQGYGSDQALLALKRHLHKFNTKAVVYTYIEDHLLRNGNYDRAMLVPTAEFLGTKPQFALTVGKKLYLSKKPLLYKDYFRSYLIDFLKMRVGKLTGSFPPHPADLTRAIIYEMKKFSIEHDADFVVLNWRQVHNNYDDLCRDLVNVDVIDTLEGAPDGWKEMVLYGGIHPNAEAGDHAARLLFNYFRAKDLIREDSAR
ncbi:MAG: hypothetical protein C4526_10200 [Nitrospiraceae bacterium]|nr:MAG: hypothetical protein C4526_10200 [Nitrospiraceae bacterium]